MALTEREINAIAYKTALHLMKMMQTKFGPNKMLTTEEVADILGVKPQRVRQLKDKIGCTKKGESKQGQLLFKMDNVNQYLGSH